MTMQWLRLYHEARTDKRLSVLSLAERGVWVNLLCYASEQVERGAFDASDPYLLAVECADGDEDVLRATIDKLMRTRHLVAGEAGRLRFRTFEVRQYGKPSDAPERVAARVRAHRVARRERQREEHGAVDVTPVTPPVTRGNAIDRDRDTERDPDPPDQLHPPVSIPFAAAESRDSPPRKGQGGGTTASQHVHGDAADWPEPVSLSQVSGAAPDPPSAAPPPKAAKPRPRNVWWDGLVEMMGYEPLGRTERSGWGKAVNDLKDLAATGDQIRARAEAFRRMWPNAELSPYSLTKHWARLGKEVDSPSRPRASRPAGGQGRAGRQYMGGDAHWAGVGTGGEVRESPVAYVAAARATVPVVVSTALEMVGGDA